ncbi:hypothetical protein VTI28DRAFT_9986 [Corynascus sepedonium]
MSQSAQLQVQQNSAPELTSSNPYLEGGKDDDAPSTSSLDSDDLHETRPNRWRGHPSTWKDWTESDRRTWAALENVRRGDLSVHLFNAFALRRGFRAGPDVDLPEDGDAPGNSIAGWDIGKYWTAWPMKAAEVPDDGLLPRTADLNEPFTFRREQGRPFAGCNLEDEISATILRCAKEKFRERGLQAQQTSGEHVVQSIEKTEAITEGETDASGMGDTTENDERTDKLRRTPRRTRRAVSPTFTPVVSADDERSYRLLRPVTRQIMSKLDDTLMILHNQRMAGLSNMSQPSASDEDETDVEAVPEKPARVSPKPAPAPRNRRGRPRKVHVPLEGETEREMLVRLARQGKRKMPTFSSGSESERETNLRRSRSRSLGRARRSMSVSSNASSRRSSVSSGTNKEKLISRWGLRNWRDVLGAAALAGFSPTVIARTAQRCSTLFKENITIHTMHEQRATSRTDGIETAQYVPGGILLTSSDEDEAQHELAQLRTISRQSSVKPPASLSPEPESDRRGRPRSSSRAPASSLLCPYPECPRAVEPFPKKSNLQRHIKKVHGNDQPDLMNMWSAETETAPTLRSRSGTPGMAHLCPYPNCPRAIEGFTKRTNLARHLQTVHGKRAAPPTDDEEDSADEMDGGVHVDRFLQPIKIRRGWRGDDAQRRPPRSRKKARAGSEELNSFL